ncbi:MAG: type II toxin-antitoxin system RelE/ParE family toxin [Dehalococcoidales bacterium]|nr:type II toxin-antitoxin system RelE/ParE family toxin [Dehalococcoidales bacterium]
MTYSIKLSTSVTDSLKQLDKRLLQRVLKKIKWLSENFEKTKQVQLTGPYSGLYKYRIGNYRLIYSIDHTEKVIFVAYFAHRSDAYKKH